MGTLLCELLEDTVRSVTAYTGDPHALLDPQHPAWVEINTLITDLNLQSDITGLDILRAAKVHHPQIRRIAWSGAGSPLIDEAREIAHHVVTKPGITEILHLASRPPGD